MRALANLLQIEMSNDCPKVSHLIQLLRDLREREDVTKTVIFTHWHPTFYQLRDQLELKGFSVYSVNPKQSESSDNSRIIKKFENSEDYAILLVTDKMSEGIDLHMANTMVNMDLPYNPAKLQQRIGRLDRFIQKSKFIEIYNLVLEDTHEIRQVEILSERMDVFGMMVGEYEPILVTDEDAETIESMETEMASILQSRDLDRLAEGNAILRVMDSALDGQIGDRQRELHPVHSRLHMLIQTALEKLGADTKWDEEAGEITVALSEDLRKEILDSKAFVPWGDGEVRAAFERVNNDGEITLKMKGRYATMGPLDPFIAACESILWYVEGIDTSSNEINGQRIVGSKENQARWQIVDDGQKTISSSSYIIDAIQNGGMRLGPWNVGATYIESKLER